MLSLRLRQYALEPVLSTKMSMDQPANSYGVRNICETYKSRAHSVTHLVRSSWGWPILLLFGGDTLAYSASGSVDRPGCRGCAFGKE